MSDFVYSANPGRVIFGSGTISRLGEEADRLGVKRIVVLSTPEQEEQAGAIAVNLGARTVGLFAGAQMHTPTDVTQNAMDLIASRDADAVVSIGGGSTTGLGKAIAFRTDLPQIVVPTTYAGSEATPILGETEAGKKVTKSDPRILPEVIIYDVDLTLTLPVGMSVTSGVNAIAHAAEALYAREANPVISMMAEEGISAIARALPLIQANPSDLAARSDALYGAWLCGVCLGSVGMALHHKLCHTLGGMFGLPHASMHTIILPYALAYNAHAAPQAMQRIARAINQERAPLGLFDLTRKLGGQIALKDIGMPAEGIEQAVDEILAKPYWNPEALARGPLIRLLTAAYSGELPADDLFQR
ncbi:alcohol dehydrogenase class IV [Phyllobacterium trifolii]|uniref:Alcohol dehydrogenase class IV n=1 Tax=Phyllobacterium trifolii TaxID=300193 RepID=A0A839UE40_9HYPH|nr:maleylacetate reductase [Phyllobacterium trifolii]MBB3148797.1 alcohol dehydrogenase class IV [Phyllobacterium trifolii]